MTVIKAEMPNDATPSGAQAVCGGGMRHPDREAELAKLRAQFPSMTFDEVATGRPTRSARPPAAPSSGNADVDAATAQANAATPSSGCNGTKIHAAPKLTP
jgi:hypothetical protein